MATTTCWSVVMMFGHDSAGVELEVRSADAVFDEEDVLGAAVQDVQAAVFIPCRATVAALSFFMKFDSDITWKGLSERFFAMWAKGPGTNTVSPS